MIKVLKQTEDWFPLKLQWKTKNQLLWLPCRYIYIWQSQIKASEGTVMTNLDLKLWLAYRDSRKKRKSTCYGRLTHVAKVQFRAPAHIQYFNSRGFSERESGTCTHEFACRGKEVNNWKISMTLRIKPINLLTINLSFYRLTSRCRWLSIPWLTLTL